ncbi:phage terminase large subunit [Bacillus cereus group sp. BfR-BA-01383]|uniref:phage terminase large subunit n=1 Tax=Bacillus cereus group sp. BfR-BA-01383 TaxID=2920327 RepID=UPI002412BFE3|nr:phage terminase large subunit [Bacillus cereus group sp. BfR-BA-01383]
MIEKQINERFEEYIFNWDHKDYFVFGGYGSSKSYHTAFKIFLKLLEEKRKCLVMFRDEEGILHAVEVDRSQKMKVNEEKLKKYEELTQIYKQKHNGKMPVIHFFTVTKYREKKLEELAAKYAVFVKGYVIEEV